MILRTTLLFLNFLGLCLVVYAVEKEFGNHDGYSDDWNKMKWYSDDSSESIKASTEDPNKLDELFSLPSESSKLEKDSKLNKNDPEDFSNDEVFIEKTKSFLKRYGADNSEQSFPKEQDLESFLNGDEETFDQFRNLSINQVNEITGEELGEIGSPKDNLEQANSDHSNSNEKSNFQVLGDRSFIFNPMAEPQEQFQNCTTPKNETGSCKYLQHCLFPTIVSSLMQFVDYVCIIEGRFIGVCCPNLPVSVVVVQEQDEEIKGETELNENCSFNPELVLTCFSLIKGRMTLFPTKTTADSLHFDDCGVAANTRIVGGADANPKAWPWMVALLTKSRKRFFCGGSLINDVYVLTAAHCTFGIRNNEVIARVGEYDFRNDEGNHDEYAVVEMKRHGHYNRRNLKNDIALLKLEKPVKFNEFVQTICFPEGEKDYVGNTATLAGWGNLAGDGPTSEVLQQTALPVISNEDCAKGHGLPIPESFICTASKAADTGACNGDSGGPLMLLDENNRWKVIGLVSWGRRGCDPEFPTVYTRVSFYLDWIKKHAT